MILRHVINAITILIRDPSLSGLAKSTKAPYEPGEELPWWADNIAHMISGAIIGIVLSLFLTSLYVKGAYIVLAIVWEIFEYTHDVRPWDPEDDWSLDRAVEDTLLDVTMGYVGVVVVLWIVA